MVIITSKYVKPLTVIDALLADRRKFLAECRRESKLLYWGARNPRDGDGDAMIADVGIDEARALVKKDPLFIAGAAEYQFVEFTPGRTSEGLFWEPRVPSFIFD